MNRLNYNQLYYFYIVATEGSVKAASRKLHLTQPTISGQLRTLESDLGFDLFERKHRKLVLNEKGKLILKKAEKIFLLGEDLVNSLHGKTTKVRSDIRVGVAQTLTSTFLHDFTMHAWQDPYMQIRVVHGNYRHLIGEMNDDNIDLILSDSPIQISSKRYKNINMGSEPLIVVGASKFTKVRKNFPDSLNGIPFLSFGLSGQVHSEIEYFFRINNIQPDYLGGADDLNLNQAVAEDGTCVTILPQSMAAKAIRSKKLVHLGEFPGFSLNHWVITSQTSSRKLLVRRTINDYLQRTKSKS